MLAALDRASLRDSIAVILVSDHGEAFEPERGRIHHCGRLHADQIRIPMLARVPGFEPRRVDAPVSLVDVLPSVLDLLGLAAPANLDGVSLAGAMRGEASATCHF